MQVKAHALLCAMLTLSAGCGSSTSPETPLQALPSSAPPAVWKFAATEWTRTDNAADADWAVLRKFFEQHPSYAESAEFAGDPVLYRNSAKERLYLWIRPVVDGFAWQLIRQHGPKYHHESGTGIPWQS